MYSREEKEGVDNCLHSLYSACSLAFSHCLDVLKEIAADRISYPSNGSQQYPFSNSIKNTLTLCNIHFCSNIAPRRPIISSRYFSKLASPRHQKHTSGNKISQYSQSINNYSSALYSSYHTNSPALAAHQYMNVSSAYDGLHSLFSPVSPFTVLSHSL